MSLTLLKVLADFDTQLAAPVSAGDTTATLVTATDDDGNALPAGSYGFTIDNGNASKEYFACTLSGVNLTNIVSLTRQDVSSVGFARAHRRGSKVIITDWVILSRMLKNLNGTTGFNSLVKLGYDGDPSINSSDLNKFATVRFVNNQLSSGAPDAGVLVKGISRLSVSPDVALGNCTITIASPAVITKTAHGLTVDDSVVFSTTGSLPTGIVAGTTYYVISTGLTSDDFEISDTLGGTAVDTSGIQSGTHSVTKTTPVAVGDQDPRLPTQDENDALVGASGDPSSTNVYETQNDTSNAATMTATTIAFVNSNPDTITDSGNGFVTAGFKQGQSITITGSGSNDGTYTIAGVAAGTLTLIASDTLVNEIAGASVTIQAVYADKLVRYKADGNISIPGTPSSPTDAANQQYVSTRSGGQLSMPLGESFTGATTPQPAYIANDIWQPQAAASYNVGENSGSKAKLALKIVPRKNVSSNTIFAIIAKTGTPSDNIRCVVQTDNAGEPSGTPISNGTSNNVTGASLSSAAKTYQTFTFASSFALVAGTTYWIVFERTGALHGLDFYYVVASGASTDTYGAMSGKSYDGGTWIASVLPYVKIVPDAGSSGSLSLWQSDADAAGNMNKQFHGFVTTTGSAGATGDIVTSGLVEGFASLIPYISYNVSTTKGAISTTAAGMNVGQAQSATSIYLPTKKTGVWLDLGSVTSGLTSAAQNKFEAFADGTVVATNATDAFAVSTLVIDLSDDSGGSTNLRQFYLDDETNGHRNTITVPVRKGQFVRFNTVGANGTAEMTFIPEFN